MIKHALKIKVSFNEKDTAVLESQSKITNWLHNHLIEKAQKLRTEYIENQSKTVGQTLYTKRGLRNLLPSLKVEHPFLKAVHSSPLKNKALEVSNAIQAYQKSRKGKRKGKQTGWPKFRSHKKKWCSLYYDEPGKGFKINGRELIISLGQTEEGKRLKAAGTLEVSPLKLQGDKILNFRLIKENGVFYAVFITERETPKKKPIERVISLDPNHKNLAYGADTLGSGIEIKNPWFLKPLQHRIDIIKSKRDRCKRKSKLIESKHHKSYWLPSRRWLHFHHLLEDLYRIRRDQTKTYLYTLANKLYKNYDLVSIGDYTPRGGGITKGMRRSMNNESLIGRFKEVLEWVAIKSGKEYLVWNEYKTTKTCSHCSHELESSLNPSIRSWQCPSCDIHHIRDENAALNGLQKTKEMLGSSLWEIVEITSRRAWRHSGLGVDNIPGMTVDAYALA